MSPEGVTGFGLKDLNWVFGIWLILVVLWNFGYPDATPIMDILVTLGLFFVSSFLKT